MTDFAKLIPELPNWNNGKGIDVASWIGCMGDFQKAIGYSVIFWPEFIEIDGYVLRAGVTREALQRWIEHCGTEKKSIEGTANHLHIRDLQYWNCPDATPERLVYLGRVLKEIYECKLRRDFPERTFKVEFYEGDADDLDGFELTFYQE